MPPFHAKSPGDSSKRKPITALAVLLADICISTAQRSRTHTYTVAGAASRYFLREDSAVDECTF